MQNNMTKITRLTMSDIQKLIPWIFWALSALPLIALMILGTSTRYLADDYSTASILVNQGFWKAQSFWYHAWSGRYSFTFLVSLIEMVGVRIVPWLPMMDLFTWATSLFWTVKCLFAVLEIKMGKIWIAIVVNILIFGTIRSFSEYAQVIFWQTGILTYQVSIIFITSMIGIFLTRFYLLPCYKLRTWEIVLWFLAFFIGGGFSETWVVIQISLLGLSLFFFSFTEKSSNRNDILYVLFIGFMASCVSLLVIVKAPGNMNRDNMLAELSFDLLRYSVIRALMDVPVFLMEWFLGHTILVTMLILTGLSAGLIIESSLVGTIDQIRLGIYLLISAYVLMLAGFVPQFAVMGIRPAERVIFMPMFLFLCAFELFVIFTGSRLKKFLPIKVWNVIQIILMSVLFISIFWISERSASSLFQIIPSMQLYARLWDSRDAFLRQASLRGEKVTVAASLRRNPALHDIQSTFWIEGDLQDIPDHWINQMAASYYKLPSIALH